MESLVNMVAQRTGLSDEKARAAVDTVVNYIKERAPAGLSGQIDSLVGGSGGAGGTASGTASQVSGMFGKKDQE